MKKTLTLCMCVLILSCAGEDELVRSFYWQAAGAVVLCVLGAVATAWLLGVNRF